jgi:uncharacterized protein
MRGMKFKFIGIISSQIVLAALLFFIYSCKKKKTDSQDVSENFDKAAMLINYSSNVIVPNYIQTVSYLDNLKLELANFKSQKTLASFNLVRDRFLSSYLAYQHVSMFEFGPAETEQIRINLNVFPTDTLQINTNIISNTYDLNAANNIDAKGFPAIDYLLFSDSNDSIALSQWKSSPLSANRFLYLESILNDVYTKLSAVKNQWSNNYSNTFNQSLDASIGSSLGNMVNQMSFEMENAKNLKLGIPLGKKTLGNIQPNKCEAYYSKKTLALLKENVLAMENVYLGRSKGGADGKGFEEYLIAINAAYNGGNLDEAIKNQFQLIKQKLNALSDPLSDTIISDASKVNLAYIEIQKMVVLLKADLPSALGVVITYQDGDGD